MAANKNSPQMKHITTELPSVDVAFDFPAFDEAIRSQGARLVHYRAQRCPVGMAELGDNRRPHPHHEGCFNGFIYTKVGCITGMMVSNSKKKDMETVGFVDFSTIQTTFPSTYDNSDQKFIVAPFDRFFLDEDETKVVQWQLFETNESGLDRLKYPVECVEGPIIDARGERYYQGADFEVTPDGLIKWGERRPAPQVDVGPGLPNGYGADRGAICSVRFTYRPYWYVGSIPHEIRMIQQQNGFSREVVRGPQLCVLHREYVSHNVEQDADINPPNTSEEIRKVMAPMYGGFSPK
jgi:hypothetical protein